MPTRHDITFRGHKLVALAYNEDAAGRPVVFIHGIMASVAMWQEMVPAPAASGPWYSLSLPGHYPAAMPDAFRAEALTAGTIVDVLSAALRRLVGETPVTLVGHSTGGFAALALAARAPARVHRVVSIAGFAHGRWSGSVGLLQRVARWRPFGPAAFRVGVRALSGNRPLIRRGLRYFAADVPALYAWPGLEATLDANVPYARRLNPDHLLPYFKRMPDIDISDWLPAITAPTLVLGGDQDPTVPPAQQPLIAAQIPDAELVMLEGCGHLVMVERDADYRRLVGGWVQQSL